MKKLLITGFDPFGGETINPAWLAVEGLPDRVGAYELRKLQIPTIFGRAAELALAQALDFRPDVILSIGQAGGRSAITPERIAVNIQDARIPDNAGQTPAGERIAPEGPAAYFATVPVTAMARAISDAGIPATVSNSAGAFVCNNVMYLLLHHFSGTSTRVGFIHVPYLPQQVKREGVPSLELSQIQAGLAAAITALDSGDGA